MNLWRWLRQFDRIEEKDLALSVIGHDSRETREQLQQVLSDLDRERARRISAESLAGERKDEVDRLIAELADVRSCLKSVTEERLKSLDTLNVKLMEAKAVVDPPPDWNAINTARHLEMASGAMRRIRQLHHDMDMKVLTKLHPRFAQTLGPVMNGPQPQGGSE